MDSNKTVIEINGVKMEVDLRYATRIDHLQVGSRVKCLVKTYSEHQVYPGVIVGFEPFQNLPSIVVAYLKNEYSGADLVFKSYNAESKDFEIVADQDNTSLEVNKQKITTLMQRDINKKQAEVQAAQEQLNFFLKNFASYFVENQTEPN